MNLSLIMLIINQEINPNCGRSLQITDSPDWIKNKKATIISINKKDDKCFQYAVTVALYHEQIEKDPPRIIKLIFLSKYNCEEINYQSEKDDWEQFAKNNVTIAYNVLYVKKRKNMTSLFFKT